MFNKPIEFRKNIKTCLYTIDPIVDRQIISCPCHFL